MEKLFTDKEYSEKAIEANSQGNKLYIYTHMVEYEAEVLEWDVVEKQVERQKVDEEGNPMYDEEGNPIMEIVIIQVRVPRMVEIEVERQKVDEEGNPMYDEEGNPIMEIVTIEVQAHHTETFEKEVAELVIADYDYYVCYKENYTDGTINANYEEEKAQRERAKLDALTLTPADVERALYKAKEMDFTDLKELIHTQLPSIDMKALSIEFRAKDFYRGAVASGARLFDVVGQLLGYTPADMDYLFTHKELPVKKG